MLVIDGEKYLVEKEIASKIGYSPAWFRKARFLGEGPPYYKLNRHVYYNLEKCEEWFKEHLKSR